jgi:hypothetical protein
MKTQVAMKTPILLIQLYQHFLSCGIKWMLWFMISQVFILLLLTACFMFNSADVLTNIELADDIQDLNFSLRSDFTDAL